MIALDTDTLALQPLTAREDCSLREKLFLFERQARDLDGALAGLVRETRRFGESARLCLREGENAPNEIREGLLTAFEEREEKKINQSLAHQKGENHRMHLELGRIRDEHALFQEQLRGMQEQLSALELRIGLRIAKK